jgi:hypothetical protein
MGAQATRRRQRGTARKISIFQARKDVRDDRASSTATI